MSTLTTSPSAAAVARADTPARGRAPVVAGYLARSLLQLMRDWSFLIFIVALPTTLYLFFAAIYGDQTGDAGVTVAAIMMVTMAAYGGLGAAMNAGNSIQSERSSGWLRHLMLTSLTPTEFLLAKALAGIGIVVPAIGVVFLAGALRGVRMDAPTWAASFALLLASLTPMIILGLAIGLWFRPQAAQALTTVVMLVLSMVGGLWFPLSMMPAALQVVGKALPSYWAGQLGIWPLTGGEFPWTGVGVLVVWTGGLIAVGVVGYGRAVRTSKR